MVELCFQEQIGLGIGGRKFKGRTGKKDGVSYANMLTAQNSVRPVRHWEVMPIQADHRGNSGCDKNSIRHDVDFLGTTWKVRYGWNSTW